MITVNLLPRHLRPIKRTPLPHLLSLLALVLVLAGLALVLIAVEARQSGLQSEINETQAKYDKFADIVNESNTLTVKKEQLQTKIETIQEILIDRIIWSEQLYNLSRLTPENMWYKRIRTTYQSFQEEEVLLDPKTGKPEIDKRTKQQKTVKKTVKRPIFEVSGYVVNDKEGSNQVYPLTRNTTTDPEFNRYFKLYRPFTEPTEFNGYSVQSFTLEYSIKPGGES
ncbi:MAG: hypothetical protein HYV27_00050 [Candidatus Hydrogenedentes bacterium]|nr:hypothetical protein [Candidatus Hydrogenedentota bacterium]